MKRPVKVNSFYMVDFIERPVPLFYGSSEVDLKITVTMPTTRQSWVCWSIDLRWQRLNTG